MPARKKTTQASVNVISTHATSPAKENVSKILLSAIAQESKGKRSALKSHIVPLEIDPASEPFTPLKEVANNTESNKAAVVTPVRAAAVIISPGSLDRKIKSKDRPLSPKPQNLTPIFTKSFKKSSILIDPRVETVYKVVRRATGALGGNGYDGAIYGELTMHSMQRVVNILVEKCGMNHTSRFIDVGAGLGKPNFHAAQDPAVRVSLGVELEDIRWQVRH